MLSKKEYCPCPGDCNKCKIKCICAEINDCSICRDIYIEACGHGLVALVDATPESDENKANASIMAAAPDLLEAAKSVLQYQKCDADCGCNWTDLRAAIAKAEGK